MQDVTRTGGSVLIGREPEVARVEAVLDQLRSSMGEALVIRGAAGIGKSALLLHARSRAEAAGTRVLPRSSATAARSRPPSTTRER